MGNYLLKRMLQIIPVLLILTFIIFCLVYVAGDPVALMLPPEAGETAKAALRKALGLDKPFAEQYLIYLGNLLRGNFGTSYVYNQDALSLVLERIPYSIELAMVSLCCSVVLGIVLGVAAAHFRNTPLDLFVNGLAALGQALPGFWVAIMLILLFAVQIPLLPVSGAGTWIHLVLPSATLTILTSSKIIPLIRSNMIEVMQQDYIRTARVKGMDEKVVVFKHALRNALIPVVTVAGLQFGQLLGGAVLTEKIFSYPGLGTIMVDAIYQKDTPQILGSVCFVALTFTVMNLIVDILYGFIDPRIKTTFARKKRRPAAAAARSQA